MTKNVNLVKKFTFFGRLVNKSIDGHRGLIVKYEEKINRVVLQNIYGGLAQSPDYKAVDVLANYKSRFEERSKLPTIERTIAQKGVILYDRV